MTAIRSTTRASAVFAACVVASNASQVGWLAAADRVMSAPEFGAVLAAQALYSVLQIVIDSSTAFYGARLVASGEATAARRDSLVGMRILLGFPCVGLAAVVAAFGSVLLRQAVESYVVALLLFSILNVWEPYGRGRVGPYALYLVLRSAGLAVVGTVFLIVGARLPAAAAGAVESVVLVAVMAVFRLRLPGRGAARDLRAAPWRAAFDIGLPAVISQYNPAVAVVLLGVAGRTTAAAVVAVGARLVSGTVALSGAVAQGLFPRLAVGRDWTAGDRRAASTGLWLAVALSCGTLALGTLAAPLVIRAFLHPGIHGVQAAVIVILAAAGAAGMTLHLSLVLIACRHERWLRAAAVWGSVVISCGALASVSVPPLDAALAAAVSFLAGQTVTAILLGVRVHRLTPFPPRELRGMFGVLAGLALLGLVGGLDSRLRIPAGVALAGLTAGVSVRPLRQLWRSASAALAAGR